MANKTVAAIVKLIDQFSSPSKEIKKQAQDLEKRFKNVGNAIKNTGGIMSGIGSTMSKGITAPIVGIGTASIAAFNEVDAGLDTIIQKTGATGKAAKGFEDAFENVATSVPADMADVGNAIGEINTRLGLTGGPLEDATEKFIKFADLNGTDVNSAIATVTRAMGDAGIAAEDYGSILDQMNVAGQVSGISMDALAENLTKYGAPMRALGIDTQNSIAMFAGWEKAGVNTEIAFSGMKKAISNWGKEGKDSTVEFKNAMKAIKEAPDIASATSMAIETFGAKAGPDLADAIKGGRFEIDEYMKALDNAGGSVENTFAGTEDGVDKFKTASNAAKIALSELGGVLSEAVGPILEQATDKIKDASKWFAGLDDATKQNIVKFGLMAAAAGPLLLGVGKITTGIGGTITTFGKLNASVFEFTGGAAKLTTPIKLIGTGFRKLTGSIGGIIPKIGSLGGKFLSATPAIAGIAAVALLVYRNFDKIKSAAEKMANRIKSVAKSSGIDFDGLRDRFSSISEKIKTIVGKLSDKFNEIKEKLAPVLDFVDAVFVAGIEAAFKTIEDTVSTVIESIGIIFDGFEEVLDGIIMVLDGDFKGGFSRIFGGIGDIIKGAVSGWVGIVKTPINGIINLVNKAIDGINSFSITFPDIIAKVVGVDKISFNIPHIPTLAVGTNNWKGGIAQISEKGGEIVDLPQGTRVYPHDESVRMARQEAGRPLNITIPKLADQIVVREDADIDRIAEAIVRKLEKTQLNMA